MTDGWSIGDVLLAYEAYRFSSATVTFPLSHFEGSVGFDFRIMVTESLGEAM